MASTQDSLVLTHRRDTLRFLACGSVDDGKSTLIGRLLHDATELFDDQLVSLQFDSRRYGTTGDDLDFALLLDGLEAEREQSITIDVAWRYFGTAKRAFMVADTPGHEQYTRNMATGASNADLAVLLVDARNGLMKQTRRHAAIVSLLGIRHVVLAINKMDLVSYSAERFRQLEQGFARCANHLRFSSIKAIPLSALGGDNVATKSARMAWYSGPTLLEHLETVAIDSGQKPFRFPVQWVNRPNPDFRGFAGTVTSGQVAVGDRIVVAGSGRLSSIGRIVTRGADLDTASAGRSVTLTLTDEIDASRGDVLAAPLDRPVVTKRLAADLIWMEDSDLRAGAGFLLKIGTNTVPATVTAVADVLDIASLERRPCDRLGPNDIGRTRIETAAPVAIDAYADIASTGSFILIDRTSMSTAAAGLVIGSLDSATNVHHQPEDVTPAMRAAQKGQKPLVVWLTGLPGAGKSTIANLLERHLVAAGHHTILLDGDNLRQGVNADLGFDPTARTENVRRVGEIAKLMTDAGLIAIVALVSPFQADRARAAALVPAGRFVEVFVDTPPEICRQRDTKGLYRKAEAGLVSNVTGRDQAYEPPEAPAIALPAGKLDAASCAALLAKEVLAIMI